MRFGGSANEVDKLVRKMKPILARRPAAVQGAALADCLAIWLAGHHIPGNHDATAELRRELLLTHLKGVQFLIPINARTIGTTE